MLSSVRTLAPGKKSPRMRSICARMAAVARSSPEVPATKVGAPRDRNSSGVEEPSPSPSPGAGPEAASHTESDATSILIITPYLSPQEPR